MTLRRIAALLVISGMAVPALALEDNTNGPAQNPYASASRYGARHSNPARPTAFPYPVPDGTFHVELPKFPRIVGGPGGFQQIASTDPDFIWITTTGGVVYADVASKRLRQVAFLATPGPLAIPTATLEKLMAQPVASVGHAQTISKELGVDEKRLSVNAHAVVDKENVLYASAGDGLLHAYGLVNAKNPAQGIRLLRSIDLGDELKRVTTTSTSSALKSSGAIITALALTYDGYLIVGTSRSLLVLDREFKRRQTTTLDAAEVVHSAVTVDAKGGIFVASDTSMHKIVWTGQRLSRDPKDGAWSSLYDVGREPPTLRKGRGAGGTPTLMGFGTDPDKLVVITDGADRMKVVAFWRDEIPADFKQQPGTRSRRVAGQLLVGAGLDPKPEFIQSEQPVVAQGYGAFVVNGVKKQGDADALVDALVAGPVYAPPIGVERLEWLPGKRAWRSVWARGDVVATSMVPAVSTVSNIVLVNGYTKDGWELTGLDWSTGKTVHRSMFGRDTLGNGAHAFIQFLPNGDLLFNSIGGPIRVHYLAVIARPKT